MALAPRTDMSEWTFFLLSTRPMTQFETLLKMQPQSYKILTLRRFTSYFKFLNFKILQISTWSYLPSCIDHFRASVRLRRQWLTSSQLYVTFYKLVYVPYDSFEHFNCLHYVFVLVICKSNHDRCSSYQKKFVFEYHVR